MDPYHPLGSVTSWLSWSVRLGRPFGIEVRMYWTAVLVVLVGALEFGRWPGVGPLEAAGLGLLSAAVLYLVVWTHEMGHAWAGRRFGVATPTITLSALGGLAHLSAPAPNPRAEAWISIAGPFVHVLWFGAAWVAGPFVPPLQVGDYALPLDTMDHVRRLNLFLLAFNLLPFFPMDGGRVLRSLLARRLHPNHATLWAARVGALGAILFMAAGISERGFGGTLLLVIGLNNLLVCVREMAAARWSEGPYGSPPDPWEQDPDAWKTGSSTPKDEPRRGLLRRKHRRATPTVEDSTVATAIDTDGDRLRDDAELDRLLARVSEVGLAGLTPGERTTLQRISRARRREP